MTTIPVTTLSVHDLKQQWDVNPALCVIDVRELDEWHALHIPHAIHVPKAELESKISSIVPSHDTPIYLHCAGGTRSKIAAETLLNMGYKTVYSVDGGIRGWHAAGYPTQQA